jgi:hypothetical protein
MKTKTTKNLLNCSGESIGWDWREGVNEIIGEKLEGGKFEGYS